MKRFTSLMLMLLCAVTTWAQNVTVSTADAPEYYLIASYDRGGVLTSKGVDKGAEHVAVEEGSFWYFEAADENGGVYFVNKVKDGENKIYLGENRAVSKVPYVWYILENGVNKNGLVISSTKPFGSYTCVDANNSNSGVGDWQPSNDDWKGTTWVFAKSSEVYNTTYNPNNAIHRSRNDRYVKSISVNSNKATIVRPEIPSNGYAYIDLTGSVKFYVEPRTYVTPAIERDGHWTNAYAYIDYNNDGFTASVAEDGYTPAGDLVSYSFYNVAYNDDPGFNSNGETLADGARNTISMPAFKAPETPGEYRMRIKHDWSDIDPNGGKGFNANGGSMIDFTLVVAKTVTVNYYYKFNGEQKGTQTSTAYVGYEYPDLTVEMPFGVTAAKPSKLVAEEDAVDGVINVDITLEENLPFKYAADAENIKNWYYVQMHSSGGSYSRFLQYVNSDEATYIEWLDVEKKSAEVDTYTWAFVGDPFAGFKMVNYGAPEGANAVVSNGSGNPSFGAFADATAWNIKASAVNNDAEHFCFQYPGSNQYMNAQSGKIAFWGSADQGSTMWVTERDMTGVSELEALIAEVEAANYTAGINVGAYTQESVNAVNKALAAAKAEAANAGKTLASVTEAIVALQEAVANLAYVPVREGTYMIVSAKTAFNREKVLSAYAQCGWYGTHHNPGWTQIDESDPLQYWTIEEAQDGKFYIKAAYEGNYITSASSLSATPTAMNIEFVGGEQVTIAPEGQQHLHCSLHGWGVSASSIENYNGGKDSPSAWYLVEIDEAPEFVHTLTVGDAGYSTLMLGFNAAIPTGVEVYTAKVNGNFVDLTAVEGGVLPANTAVIVKADADDYTFTYTTETATVENNDLLGTLYNKEIVPNGKAYVLSAKNGNVGLYAATLNKAENTAFLNNANKAYLVVEDAPEAPDSYSFRFGEGTTDVENVVVENEVKAIYDLTGRRVEAITAAGIYIVNGKKVLVK